METMQEKVRSIVIRVLDIIEKEELTAREAKFLALALSSAIDRECEGMKFTVKADSKYEGQLKKSR